MVTDKNLTKHLLALELVTLMSTVHIVQSRGGVTDTAQVNSLTLPLPFIS